MQLRTVCGVIGFVMCAMVGGAVPLLAQSRTMVITKQYLNVPVDSKAKMQIYEIDVKGQQRREFPVQLAAGAPDLWIYVDVSEFKGSTIELKAETEGAVGQAALDRIYQADRIAGWETLYKEKNRPQFHFSAKRGWLNDVNGPIFFGGQYHLFYQAFPFGYKWDTDFMYWGHAVSKDLMHWRELPAALINDRLGSPWSGSSLVDHANSAGFGKDALVLVYTAYDRHTKKQVQCLAYSTDGGKTFTHYAGNPVLDSNEAVGSKDTRDPHVFWYAPGKRWVMVLFERDGLSIYNSADLKTWVKKSHLKGMAECPDLFELPVDGDKAHTKWVLHGGSSKYLIGSFDGETFTPESGELRYAEGKTARGADVLYAAQSFAEMPDGRRVQMAWGRVELEGMPFNQLILVPTEFKLKTTAEGVRMRATPVAELARLRGKASAWRGLSAEDANGKLAAVGRGAVDVKLQVAVAEGDELKLQVAGQEIAAIKASELEHGRGDVEVLLDRGVAEVFVEGGARYIVRELSQADDAHGLELSVGQKGSVVDRLEVFAMKSMWK